jgi:hypothetical protein
MRFGKSLDLLLSFCTSNVFPRPAALDLILKYDAVCSFFEPPLDVFGERLKTPMLIDQKVINCTHFLSLDLRAHKFRRERALSIKTAGNERRRHVIR